MVNKRKKGKKDTENERKKESKKLVGLLPTCTCSTAMEESEDEIEKRKKEKKENKNLVDMLPTCSTAMEETADERKKGKKESKKRFGLPCSSTKVDNGNDRKTRMKEKKEDKKPVGLLPTCSTAMEETEDERKKGKKEKKVSKKQLGLMRSGRKKGKDERTKGKQKNESKKRVGLLPKCTKCSSTTTGNGRKKGKQEKNDNEQMVDMIPSTTMEESRDEIEKINAEKERKKLIGMLPITMEETGDVGIPVGQLTDDALLIIFSQLSIKEKVASISRVCKRWNRVVKVGAIWRHVDMWEWQEVVPSSVRRSRKLNKPYTRRQAKIEAPAKVTFELRPMIKKERKALKFLQTYISGSLRTLNLCVVSDNILQFLRDNCPKLEILTLGSSFEHRDFLPAPGIRNVDFSLVPSSVVKLKIQSGWAERGKVVPPNPLEGLAKDPFPNMKELILERHVSYPAELFQRLSHCTALKSLSLISFERVGDFAVLAKGLAGLEELCLQSCIRENAATKKVLFQIADNMTSLMHIKLRAGPTPQDEQVSVDCGISRLRSCKNLRQVWLENLHTFSISGFKTLTTGLPNLQEVVLVDCDRVDDAFLEHIQNQLKSLKLLRLIRCVQLTDFGTKFLLHHPSIEHLEIVGKLQTTRVFPTPKIICEIAESMESLKTLKVLITGHPPTDVLKPHFHQLKNMRPEMEIRIYLRPDVEMELFGCRCSYEDDTSG
ncbi:uncharacterized protein [Amphiura filiformis]|uniref:uncharacterized protein n=1 Tax=Amphiura filiformis TaxID=82378 RepID=UPI003B20B997